MNIEIKSNKENGSIEENNEKSIMNKKNKIEKKYKKGNVIYVKISKQLRLIKLKNKAESAKCQNEEKFILPR